VARSPRLPDFTQIWPCLGSKKAGEPRHYKVSKSGTAAVSIRYTNIVNIRIMNNKRNLAILILGMSLIAACSKQDRVQPPAVDTSKISAGSVKTGQGKGIVRAIDTGARTITLDHGTIPNVMDAMTMEYYCDQPKALRELKVGDSVAFTLQDRGEGNFVVSAISPVRK
jgi:Cu/Ag efflux protein CusF